MKVLQLCGKDFFGAGRAAYRLHKGLQKSGVESVMWVGAKRTHDNTVVNIHATPLKKKLTKVLVKLEKLKIKYFGGKAREMFSLGTFAHSIKKKIEKEEPDIVHLHWVNRGFFNINELKGLNIPIVISLHDMWWFTGGCHYDEECKRYTNYCGKCPVLQSDNINDLSFKYLNLKQELLNSFEVLSFVGLSSWMADCVRKSAIGQEKNIVQLPNGIDISNFAKVDKNRAREKLQLPKDKKLVLFAAVDVLSEQRKGYIFISESLTYLSDDYELVVVGEKSREELVGGLKAHFIGEINNDKRLIEYMSAVDVSVVPSLQENLSNLIMESLSCSTPVVAFAIGGNKDMIKHKKNGYLAIKESVIDLADGIKFCCDKEKNDELGSNARESIVNTFKIDDVSKLYMDLYQSLMIKV